MRPIIIHNDNFPFSLKNFRPQKYKFKGNFKEFIKKRLIENNLNYDCFIISYSLSQNYLEFVGLELAYHIRLAKELGDKRFLPIIFWGLEHPYLISKLTWKGQILYTDGIYVVKGGKEFKKNEEKLIELLEKKLKGTSEEKIKEQIVVPRPKEKYSSRHSVANEWSIYRWARYLKITDKVSELENRINNSLYYKYLLNKNPIEEISGKEIPVKKISGHKKVLLIDDEYKKGWDKIFKKLFEKSFEGDIEFRSLETDFNEKKAIVEKAIKEIKKFDPDVVILDLRLLSSELSEEIDKFSAIEILRRIKVLNQGIQVIIFTASNKVWNLQKLEELDADSYIIKESPEFTSRKSFTNYIESFINTISSSFNKSYLKDLYIRKEKILKKGLKLLRKVEEISNYKDAEKTIDEMERVIGLSFNILKNEQKKVFYEASFIFLYRTIELLVNLFINENDYIEEFGNYYFKFRDGITFLKIYDWNEAMKKYDEKRRYNKRSIEQHNGISTYLKVINFAKQKTEIDDENIYKFEKINKIRNSYMHPKNSNVPVEIEKEDVIEIFNFLHSLILGFKEKAEIEEN